MTAVCWGELKTKIILPPPDQELIPNNINFRVSNGDWRAQIEELDIRRESGLHDDPFTEFSQVQEAASMTVGYEFRGRFVAGDQVVSGDQWLEDRIGNLFGLGSFKSALPTGSGVWKFVAHVARSNDALFETDELQQLGDFRFSNQVEFHKANNKGGPTGLVLIPKGDRDVELNYPGFEFPVKNSQPVVGRWAMGESLDLGYGQAGGQPSSFGGGSDGWTAEEGIGTRFSTDRYRNEDDDVNELRQNSVFTSSSPFRKIEVEADLPLVILATLCESDHAVHHLIAKDETGKKLSVHPCYHVIQDQPVFAIDVDEGTSFSLSYCQEPLCRLDFVIPAPHTAIEPTFFESTNHRAILVPDGNDWQNLISEPSNYQ